MILTQDRSKYTTILASLIAQNVFLLMKKEVTLRCLRNDYDVVKQLIPDAMNKYKQELKQKDIKVNTDEKNFLPDDSFVY